MQTNAALNCPVFPTGFGIVAVAVECHKAIIYYAEADKKKSLAFGPNVIFMLFIHLVFPRSLTRYVL